jgi:hypothetical protein
MAMGAKMDSKAGSKTQQMGRSEEGLDDDHHTYDL